jgi:DNA-binding SARP family transcriptional activator
VNDRYCVRQTGQALADFRYEPFARDEIGRLDELRLLALEQRLEADIALGRHAQAVPELEALVCEHPLRERFRALLMVGLYRSGRQADALAAYQVARAALVDELGLDPSEELRLLEAAILRHDPSLDLPAVPPAGHEREPRPAAALRAGRAGSPRPPQWESCSSPRSPRLRCCSRAARPGPPSLRRSRPTR